MIETQKVKAKIFKVQYLGKKNETTTDDDNNIEVRKNASVSITFRAALKGLFGEEIERRYFPGLKDRANKTKQKMRHCTDSLKMTVPEQTMLLIDAETHEVILTQHGVELHGPLKVVAKGGSADLFIRIKFQFTGTLDILKSLDQCEVLLDLNRTQAEFSDALAAALEFDNVPEEGKETDPFDDEEEEEGDEEHGGNDVDEDAPVDLVQYKDELDSDGVPLMAIEASEMPCSIAQVDFRLCNIKSEKVQTELGKHSKVEQYEIGQTAALIAFDRLPAKGRKIHISTKDFNQAKKEYKAGRAHA